MVKNQGELYAELRREHMEQRKAVSPAVTPYKEEKVEGEKPVMILLKDYTFKDDAITVIDMKLRNMLHSVDLKPDKVNYHIYIKLKIMSIL